ncbi:GntR family transcriptional regulator [Micromonospora sp. HUAS LYJ1]|uniref:GntR family transcriptional regulator n=1 Tax=Micromonospora sp. HUAS LYJ1 TaxID=3061626 RepID=UPI002673F28C|nr:winged helix-turn-helix domain-containing protein [Micromonospora sp. HUAS LYJ1]WKU08033.1 winged helix-turn-helix domain-containing protein [Micromonospora sp. HUAS LYJ1]
MINFAAERAAYRQLADLLREQIAAGQPGPGDLLPSMLRISQEAGVGLGTVRRALRVLRDEGLIVMERGYGARVVEQEQPTVVSVPRGGRVRVRMPTEADRRELEIAPGAMTAVIVVTVGGRLRGTYRADRVELVAK